MRRFDFMKRFAKKSLVLFSVIALVLAGLFFAGFKDNSFELIKNIDIYTTLFKELNTYYVDEIDPGKTIKTSIDEMLESLDPYTIYIPESEMEDYRFMTTGSYGGVGALIRKTDGRVVITDPYEGFPAQEAGLKAGDILLKVGDFDTNDKSIEDVSEKLKGQPGTTVVVEVKRPGVDETITKEIVRKKVHVPAVPYFGMHENNTGYIRLSSFTHKASKDVKDAMMDLKSQGATSYILDLRGNPGGLLDEAVEIVNLFVPSGELIVSTRGKVKKWNKEYFAQKEPIAPNVPVVVLVNSGSASASEIVSGAIQDLDRGVVIGTRTFGKGLVQATRPLSYNSTLKLTTAKYYIPSGRCIQALDYSHREEDGSVGKIPDSLISEYTTKNGRKVYDGGGIKPDIVTEQRKLSKIAISLIRKNLIFDFATHYALKHESIGSAEEFTLSEDDYNDFVAYISKQDYDYKLKSMEKLEELESTLEKEKYLSLVESQIQELKKALKHDKEKDLRTFKDEIKELLSEEISSRYYYQKGRILTALQYDPEIDSAITVLNDSARMGQILARANE